MIVARAPGRVNLMGGHVDYNEGKVLPVAVDRAVFLAAAPTVDKTVTLQALDLDQSVAFHLDSLAGKTDTQGRPLPEWALYPAGVAWSLLGSGIPVCGMRAAYNSDVPIGAGLSSSAAVELAFAVTWQALDGGKIDPLALAQLCQLAENRYVGVSCGLMDQFASAHGVAGHALYLDIRNLDWEAVPLPENTVIVVADSGVRRSLLDSPYNERRAECERAVVLLRQHLPHVHALRDVKPGELAVWGHLLPEVLQRRVEYVISEIARVAQAVSALRAGKTRSFGALMLAAHQSARDLYETSTPELDALVNIAARAPGCHGARMTGAGFGGCTVNLVATDRLELFIDALKSGYRKAAARKALITVCHASQGAKADWI